MKSLLLVFAITAFSFSQIGKNDKLDHIKFNADSTKIKAFYIHYPAGPFMGGGADSMYPYVNIYKIKTGKIVLDTMKIGAYVPQKVVPDSMKWVE
jgi:hypothetical protein